MQQDITSFRFGEAYFKQNIQNILCASSQRIIKEEYLTVYSQDYLKQSLWRQVFQKMIKSFHRKIIFETKGHKKFLKQIQHINFVNLKQLLICGNQIDNIEALAYCKFEGLQIIDIKKNCINRIKCFHKLFLKNLNRLNIRGNQILQINSFTKVIFDQVIQFLFLEYDRNDVIQGQDLSISSKFNFKSLSTIYVENSKRLQQHNVLQMIDNKYSNIKIT